MSQPSCNPESIDYRIENECCHKAVSKVVSEFFTTSLEMDFNSFSKLPLIGAYLANTVVPAFKKEYPENKLIVTVVGGTTHPLENKGNLNEYNDSSEFIENSNLMNEKERHQVERRIMKKNHPHDDDVRIFTSQRIPKNQIYQLFRKTTDSFVDEIREKTGTDYSLDLHREKGISYFDDLITEGTNIKQSMKAKEKVFRACLEKVESMKDKFRSEAELDIQLQNIYRAYNEEILDVIEEIAGSDKAAIEFYTGKAFEVFPDRDRDIEEYASLPEGVRDVLSMIPSFNEWTVGIWWPDMEYYTSLGFRLKGKPKKLALEGLFGNLSRLHKVVLNGYGLTSEEIKYVNENVQSFSAHEYCERLQRFNL